MKEMRKKCERNAFLYLLLHNAQVLIAIKLIALIAECIVALSISWT